MENHNTMMMQGAMDQLSDLINEFYSQLGAEEDQWQQCRRDYKEAISEILITYGDYFKRKEASVIEYVPQQFQQQVQRGISQLPTHVQGFIGQMDQKASQIIKKPPSVDPRQDVADFLAELANLQFIKPKELFSLQSTQAEDLLKYNESALQQQIDSIQNIIHKSDLQIHQNSNINDVLYRFLKIYEDYLSLTREAFKSFKSGEEASLLDELVQNNKIAQLRCPFKPAFIVQDSIADKLIKEEFKFKNLHVVRLRPDDVLLHQRQVIAYLIKKVFFKIPVNPSIVIRLSRNKDAKKQSYYYFISAILEDGELQVDNQLFAQMYLGSMCTDHLDLLQYNLRGKLCQVYKSGPDSRYECLRNPLYHFKDLIQNNKYVSIDVSTDFYALVLELFQILRSTQNYDFQFPSGRNAELKRKRSLQLTPELLTQTFKKIMLMREALVDIREVILPTQKYFTLWQCTKRVNPFLYRFLRLDVSHLSLAAYEQFIQQNFDELVSRVLEDKNLIERFNILLAELTEAAIEKRPFEIPPSPFEVFNRRILLKHYYLSPKYALLKFFKQLDLNYDLTLEQRIQSIDFLSLQHFFLDNFILCHNIFAEQVLQFNKSWRSHIIWQQAFKSNYSSDSLSAFTNQILVEIVGILFGIDVYSLTGNQIFSGTRELSSIRPVLIYLQSPLVSKDYGFGKHDTLLESSMKSQRYDLALELLKCGEGAKVDIRCFDILLKSQSPIKNLILAEVRKYHRYAIRQLQWESIWQTWFKGDKQIHIVGRGIISMREDSNNSELPIELAVQVFKALKYNKSQSYRVLSTGPIDILVLQPDCPAQKYMAYHFYRILDLQKYCTAVEVGTDQSFIEIVKGQSLTDTVEYEHLRIKVILSILLLPSEISPDTEILVDGLPVTTNLYNNSIDSFMNVAGFQRKQGELVLYCKNVYFLMYDMMNTQIKDLKEFSSLFVKIQQWLKHLIEHPMQYPLHKQLMINLIRRAHIISKVSLEATYFDLLRMCDPLLCDYYQTLSQKYAHLTIQERYSKLDMPFSEEIIGSTYHEFNENFQQYKQSEVFEFERQFQTGPTRSLQIIQKYNRLLNNESIDMFIENLNSLKKDSHQEFLFKHVTFNDDYLTQVKKYSKEFRNPFNYLRLENTYVKDLFEMQIDRLSILSLKKISNMKDQDLITIVTRCRQLQHLRISQCSSLYYIAGLTKQTFQQSYIPLKFETLKTLILDQNDGVTNIWVSGVHIQNISINDCKNLQAIWPNNCQRLSRIRVKGCPQIKDENLQLLVIMGKRILLDDQQIAKFIQQQSSIKLEYIDSDLQVQQQYDELLFQSLRNIFQIIKQSDTLTGITDHLIKMGLLNEDVYNQTKGVITKILTPEGKAKLLASLMSCFFMNERVRSLSLPIFSRKQAGQKEIIREFLSDLKDTLVGPQLLPFAKRLEEIKFSSLDPRCLESLQGIIKALGTALDERKSLRLDFSGLKSIPESAFATLFNQLEQVTTRLSFNSIDVSSNSLMVSNTQDLNQLLSSPYYAISQVSLKNAGLEEDHLQALCANQCKHVRSLDLSQNSLRTASILGKGFPNLQSLNLSQNKLSGLALQQLNSLQVLVLQNCFQEDDSLDGLYKFITESQTLQTLDIRGNRFSEQQNRLLGKALSQSKLSELLYSNLSISNISPLLPGLAGLVNLNIIINQEIDIDIQKLKVLTLDIYSLPEDSVQCMLLHLEDAIQKSMNFTTFNLKINTSSIAIKMINERICIYISYKERCLHLRIQAMTSIVKTSVHQHKLDTFKLQQQTHCHIGLSIDGGGMRGVMPATIINYISKELKHEPHEIFDCIGGTSIGGILSLGMTTTRNGIDPVADHDEIVSLFTKHGNTIFKSQQRTFGVLTGGCRYDSAGIESVLNDYFGVLKLSDVLPGVNVITTAVSLQKQKTKSMAKVFSSRLAKTDPRKNFLLREVGRATSAAPTYFSAAQITSLSGKNYALQDGGVGKNNPSALVIEDLKKGLFDQKENFFLLSLSTGVSKQQKEIPLEQGLGQILNIIDNLGTSNEDFVHKEIQNLYKGRYLRLIPEYDLDPSKAGMDNTDIEIIQKYQEAALECAEIVLNEQKWGKYNDQSFLDWLRDNTERRLGE